MVVPCTSAQNRFVSSRRTGSKIRKTTYWRAGSFVETMIPVIQTGKIRVTKSFGCRDQQILPEIKVHGRSGFAAKPIAILGSIKRGRYRYHFHGEPETSALIYVETCARSHNSSMSALTLTKIDPADCKAMKLLWIS